MAMKMQAHLASPIGDGAFANGSRSMIPMVPFGLTTRTSKRVNVGVKCMSDKLDSSTPKPQPKVSTSFGDVFAFSGPAPERINGRLAMIGFVAAVAMELSKGSDLLTQISDGGVQWFLGTSILLSVASLVPLFRGERAEAKTEGIMNSDAEHWNGRLAMLGLVALAVTEFAKGGALI